MPAGGRSLLTLIIFKGPYERLGIDAYSCSAVQYIFDI
jgi:hypothetical protein